MRLFNHVLIHIKKLFHNPDVMWIHKYVLSYMNEWNGSEETIENFQICCKWLNIQKQQSVWQVKKRYHGRYVYVYINENFSNQWFFPLNKHNNKQKVHGNNIFGLHVSAVYKCIFLCVCMWKREYYFSKWKEKKKYLNM